MNPIALLSGSQVVLRAPREEDLPFLFSLRNNLHLQMMLMVLPRANSPQRVNEWVNRVMSDPQSVFFVVATKNSNQPLGFVQVTNMDFVHGVGDFGICFDENAHGHGFASECLHLLETYLQNVFNLRKLVLKVLTSNDRAIAFYEKAAFQRVGVLRRHFYQNRSYHDVLIMEKLFSEPA